MNASSIPADKVIPGVIYGVLAAVAWGLSPVVTRLGVIGSLDPYDVTALRFLAAGVILLPLVLRKGLGNLGWRGIAIMVVGAGAPFILILSTGLVYAPAGHGGVIIPSTMLTCSMLGGWLFLGDRPDLRRLAGYGGVLLGILLIGWEGFAGSAGPDAWIGDLMFLACGALWASYTVAARGAVFAALVPGVAILLAYPVLGEAPSMAQLAGVSVVTFGMFYALGMKRRKGSASAPTDSYPQAGSRG